MGLGNIRQPEFGQRLRQLREERGLSQRDVAGDVVNPSYISLLESGARVPTLEVVVRLAQVLEVSLQDMVGSMVLPGGETGDRDGRLVLDILARSSLDFGDLADAQKRFESAYSSARADDQLVASLEYGIALQEILLLRAQREGRAEHLRELAELAARLDVPEVTLKIEIDRAAATRDQGQLREALELAEHAAEHIGATALAGTSEHVRVLGVLISIRCETGDIADLPSLVDRMLDVAEKIDSAPVVGRAHWVACVAFARTGHAERAQRHVRYAKEMLATPATPLWEWARFARAAASALLDADADVAEVEQFVRGAHATLSMVDVPGEAVLLRVLEARYALATGNAEQAWELSRDEPAELPNGDLVRLRLTRGRALHALGRTEEGVVALRSAAQLCEKLEIFRLASQIWREIDEARST